MFSRHFQKGSKSGVEMNNLTLFKNFIDIIRTIKN